MLDWLRYFPLKLRTDDTRKGLAKGPYFSRLKPMSVKMGDNTLKLKIPRTNPLWQPFFDTTKRSRDVSPYTVDVLTNHVRQGGYGFVGKGKRWLYSNFLYRKWFFLSPWFGGRQITLDMIATTIAAPQEKHFKTSSFFHPRAFEAALAEYLDAEYGHLKEGRGPQQRGPVNWTVTPINKTISGVRFDVEHIYSRDDMQRKHRFLAFPINHQQMIIFCFIDYGGYSPTSEVANNSEVLKLIEDIFASIELELGSQTLAEWEKVKATCPDMSLVKEFGLLKWPIKPEDVGKTSPLASVQETAKQITGQ